MNKTFLFLFLATILFGISGAFQSSEKPDSIYFASLNGNIQSGQYDGIIQVKELLRHGDFGIGNEEKLKSEVVVLDGVAYGAKADGNASALSGNASVSYAVVKFFRADTALIFKEELSYKELKKKLDSLMNGNSFVAIKVTGSFLKLKYRNFYRQEKPYKPLQEALFNTLNKENIQGTMVGYYTPNADAIVSNPRYQFHVISSDKMTGGRVLDATILNGKIEVDYSEQLFVTLPKQKSGE